MFKKIFTSNLPAASLLILAILLVACGGQQNDDLTCSGSNLQAAANLAPHNVIVDPSKPITLSWTYTDPDCQPTYYEVTLGLAHDGSAPGTTQTSQSTFLNWPETLQPGNTYFWTVFPIIVTNGTASSGPGQLGYFFTGPGCTTGAILEAPQTITPPNNTPFDPAASILLRWDDPTICLPEVGYSVQVSKTADFSTVLFASQTGLITELSLLPGWNNETVENCAQYFWRVRAETSGGSTGPWSGTGSFIINNVGSACTLLEAIPTETPQPTTTATLLPQTPLSGPAWLQANVNTNCRRGPSPEYDNLDTLPKQWSARIYGRNEDSTWWYINSPNIGIGYYCWVWGGGVTILGDTSQVPVVVPPPPPTITPLPPTPTPVQ